MPRVSLSIGLIGFIDSSSTRDSKERILVMGNYFFLIGIIMSWYSKKQRILLISTTKAKYIALSHAARKVV